MVSRQLMICSSVFSIIMAIPTVAGEDESVVRDVLLARFAKLHDLIVTYTVTQHLSLPPGTRLEDAVMEHDGGVRVDDTGTRVQRGEFSILGDLFLYSRAVQSWDRGFDHPVFDRVESIDQETYILTPGRAEFLGGYKVRNERVRYRGQITDTMNTPVEYIPVILGLGVRELPRLFTEDDIKQMKIERLPDGRMILRHIGDTGLVYEWTIDPNRGYGVTHFRSEFEGKPSSEWFMDDFKQVGGLVLPYRVRATWRWGDGSNGDESILDVNEYRLNDPANTPERYHMKWPEGAWVMDIRAGVAFVARGQSLVYSDDRIYDEALAAVAVNGPNESMERPSRDNTVRADGVYSGGQATDTEANKVDTSAVVMDTGHSARWIWIVPIIVLVSVAVGVLYRWRSQISGQRKRPLER